MSKAPKPDKRFIEGPAGRLESTVESPADSLPVGVVVVCHPHPQHGGTMHNKVVHTLARSFVRMGFAALRFNFRGTEASEGCYDNGNGELDDALAAIEWMCAKYSNQPLWLAGFSFGAAIAVRAAIAVQVTGLVSVAPAVDRFGKGLAGQPRCPWLVIQGDKDEVVDVDLTVEWLDSLEPGPELLIMSGAGHFFHGKLVDLRSSVTEFVERHRIKPCL
ncbi:MAG: alpha/beta hydrolase [Proteobacteria bacterium]|nr:alpha/beta hydrolase [Pseudomonadota bacterium]